MWARPGGVVLALTLLVAVETFAVQELTLTPMHFQNLRQFTTYRTVRLLLDLALSAALVTALPRAALVALFALQPPFFVGVLIHHDYFHQPLSAFVLLNQAAEGASVANAFLPLVQRWHGLFLLTFAAKVLLVVRGLGSRAPWAARRRPALALLGTYVALFASMNVLLQPLWKIGTWDSVGGLGSIYGYLPTWSAELLTMNPSDLRERALRRASQPSRFDPAVVDAAGSGFAVGERIVFVQLESIDEALMDFRIEGREVTPALNALRRTSTRLVVQGPKGRGSSDADFKALLGKLPSADVPTFKIPGYPYEGSFPERLKRLGHHTESVHGVTGEFFNRRPAYAAMGFDSIIFKEELEARGLALVENWAALDHVILELATSRLRSRSGRQFQFVITATSHIPYPLERSRRTFFPDETDAEYAYFDSVHYVDAAIGRFVAALPPDTTVVLYGDHVSQVTNEKLGYRQVERDGVGCVPFLIHYVGDGPAVAPTRPLATSCELDLLDALTLVHRRVEQVHGGALPEGPRGDR